MCELKFAVSGADPAVLGETKITLFSAPYMNDLFIEREDVAFERTFEEDELELLRRDFRGVIRIARGVHPHREGFEIICAFVVV